MARHVPDLALFFEMGVGKSRTTIEILREKFTEHRRVLRTLILAPVIVVENWRREIAMYSKIKDHDVVCLSGSEKKRIKRANESLLDLQQHTLTRGKILITNYEAMQMEGLYNLLMTWTPEVLVCDESQRLKNHESKRAKKVVHLSDKARHRYILTGTPILNSPMDIFNQYRVLDAGETFGKNFYIFRATYFEDKNAKMPSHLHFPKYEPRAEVNEIFNNLIYRKALRVLKKDCLDLPPLVKQKIFVDLGKEQVRMYEEMRDEYITYVKQLEATDQPRAVIAQLAITKALRLQQIVSGYAKTEDGVEIPLKENPRLAALKELLEELTPSHKVIVWATFHENYRQIAAVCKELEIEYVELHGGIPGAEKTRAMDRFRRDENCRVVIANQGAAGIGVNLVEASYSVFFSRNFSLEQDLQAESRNYRGGSEQHEKVTRIDLVAAGTIDELILEALANKQNVAEKILDWKKSL